MAHLNDPVYMHRVVASVRSHPADQYRPHAFDLMLASAATPAAKQADARRILRQFGLQVERIETIEDRA